MSNDFINYQKSQINKITQIFNSTITALISKLINNVNIIKKSRQTIKSKQNQINNLVIQYNQLTTSLRNKLNADISMINSLVPPIVLPSPIVLLPPIVLPSPQIVAINNSKKKTALLIGCNYTGTQNALYGCINDVVCMNDKLIKTGFTNINIMTDLTSVKATRNNILGAFISLLSNAQSGDTVCLFYSGHGTYTRDLNGDETDGYDECIVPCDLNIITDDELKAVIQQNLKPNVTLLAMFDSCFSGSVLDLKYSYMDGDNYDKYIENNKELNTPGNVLMISGCTDNQTSADAVMDNKPNGAMTWAFLNALTKQPNCSWRELVKNMRILLKSSQFTQLPQISTGNFENIDKPTFFKVI